MTPIQAASVPITALVQISALVLLAGGLSPLVPAAPSSDAGSNDGVMPCLLVPTPQAVAEAVLGQRGEFGAAVASIEEPTSGGVYCAVGAPSAMSAGSPRGSVRLVVLDGQDGSVRPCSRVGQGVISPTGLSSHARFGAALEFGSGGPLCTLAVGAPGANTEAGSRTGLVRLYGIGMPAGGGPVPMTELVEFTPPVGSDGAAFGASLAFSPDGQQLAIGAPFAKAPGGPSFAGSVYVYGSENGEWSLQFVAVSPRPSIAATFGHALDWVGSTLVVGAPGDGDVAPGAGRVYGIEGTGPDRGVQHWEVAAPVRAGGAAGMRFGEALAAVGADTLAIGGWGRGLVEVLSVPSVGDPVHRALLQGNAAEGFGLRVTGAAGRLFVGAPFAAGPAGESSVGRVEVFAERAGDWVFAGSRRSVAPSANGEFGVSMDVVETSSGGAHVLVGAPGSHLACPRASSCAAGAAFLF